MQTIWGDFNRLGLSGPDTIDLWDDDRFRENGITLQEGEQVLVREDDELEAVGVVHRVWSEGWSKWFWYADLDMSTLRIIGRALEMQQELERRGVTPRQEWQRLGLLPKE